MLSQVDEWPEDSPQNRVLYHSGEFIYCIDVYFDALIMKSARV
jgi:hypothetical protein